jgi:enolase
MLALDGTPNKSKLGANAHASIAGRVAQVSAGAIEIVAE